MLLFEKLSRALGGHATRLSVTEGPMLVTPQAPSRAPCPDPGRSLCSGLRGRTEPARKHHPAVTAWA